MTSLYQYNQDGADYQARAVLAYLTAKDGIEASYCKKAKRYLAEPIISRWENCREQGYIVSLYCNKINKQLNIIFFEHRNSDKICAVKWNQVSINTINIDTAKFGNIYKDKYDVSYSVKYGEVVKMADWIDEQMNKFWIESK